MKDLLRQLETSYQFILVDTPPAIAVTDAAILAMVVDGAILVIRSGIGRIDMVKDAKAVLEKSGVRLIGTVLNGIKMQGDSYYYYYYYHDEKRKRPSMTGKSK
jgi:Mrp family chromosome partitioning ATPase